MKGKRDGDGQIPGLDSMTIADFWSWAYSDLRQNTVRPIFAEFVVGRLLGVESDGRLEWDAVDLRYEGQAIEVKSAAYVQAWKQERPSRISFDIAPKHGWDAVTNEFTTSRGRAADCYVFCLYPEQDPAKADPIDVPSWLFYVISTEDLNALFGDQKSVVLSRIESVTDPVTHEALRERVRSVLGVSG